MRFKGSSADLEEFRVSPQALNMVFSDVAITAHDLHGGVGDLLSGRGCEEFDTV